MRMNTKAISHVHFNGFESFKMFKIYVYHNNAPRLQFIQRCQNAVNYF
jgi:hypothetical protein